LTNILLVNKEHCALRLVEEYPVSRKRFEAVAFRIKVTRVIP